MRGGLFVAQIFLHSCEKAVAENGVHADIFFGGGRRIRLVRFARFIGARRLVLIEIILAMNARLFVVRHVVRSPLPSAFDVQLKIQRLIVAFDCSRFAANGVRRMVGAEGCCCCPLGLPCAVLPLLDAPEM